MAREQTIRDDQGRPIVEIIVAEAIKGEIFQGKVRLSEVLLQEIGTESGDIVEIFGTKNTSAVAGPLTSGETNELIVRMDSLIRQNAGVELGEPVRIKRAIPRMATLLSLETSDNIEPISPRINHFLKTKLQGMPITVGDFIKIEVDNSIYTFNVTKVEPNEVILIVDDTNLTLSSKEIGSST